MQAAPRTHVASEASGNKKEFNPAGDCEAQSVRRSMPHYRRCTWLIVLAGQLLPAILHAEQIQSDALDQFISQTTGFTQREQFARELKGPLQEFQRGNFQRCLDGLKAARGKYPELPVPRLMLSVLFLEEGQFARARGLLEGLAAENGDDPALYKAFGELALLEQRATDGFVHFERAIELANASQWSDEQETHFIAHCRAGLASVAEARGNWEAARGHLVAALKSRPNSGPMRQRLARVLFRLDEHDAAYKELQQAAADAPNLESPAVSMARFHTQIGDLKQAEQWLAKGTKDNPGDHRVHTIYASWLLDHDRPDEAIQHVTAALKQRPATADARLLRGVVARHLKDFDEAERWLQKLHEEEPANFAVSNELALVLAEQSDAAKQRRALQLAQVNARQYPRLPAALSTLGWVYFRTGRIDAAQRVLQAAVSNGRTTSDTAYYLANVLAERQRLDQVQKLLTLALESDGRFMYRTEARKWLNRLREKPDSSGEEEGG